ncbi:hypothetical protein KC342_g38 [Hortaea werneckii]|nr:hypothetical protein KC342_g38 [Hortaea werneckii]
MCVHITVTAEKSDRDKCILLSIAKDSKGQAHSDVSHGESSVQSACNEAKAFTGPKANANFLQYSNNEGAGAPKVSDLLALECTPVQPGIIKSRHQ